MLLKVCAVFRVFGEHSERFYTWSLSLSSQHSLEILYSDCWNVGEEFSTRKFESSIKYSIMHIRSSFQSIFCLMKCRRSTDRTACCGYVYFGKAALYGSIIYHESRIGISFFSILNSNSKPRRFSMNSWIADRFSIDYQSLGIGISLYELVRRGEGVHFSS